MKTKIPALLSAILFLFLIGCQRTVDETVQNAENVNAAVGDFNGNLATPSSPNIILIIGDDYGNELPGYTGGESYQTPSLDFMAENGIHFINAFSHPDGFPSRMALFTGKYNFRNYERWGYLPPAQKTIANLLKEEAGYKTCFVGKWQCDGGDARIKSAGYDAYSVFMPFIFEDQRVGRYKNPIVYQNGAYLPESRTNGKYSEDFFSNYLLNFIELSHRRRFFAVYSHNLVGSNFSPTPDDPDFAAWNPNSPEDKKYFPGMVAYQDKIVGKILTKLRQKNILDNTCIIFIGDNATSKKIRSIFNGQEVNGGKNNTNIAGTQTPMLLYWPAVINGKKNQTRKNLIDYTDMMPTLADIANVSIPTSYGQMDGTTFLDNVLNLTNQDDRSWVFTHWDNSPLDEKLPIRYVHDMQYKLYDSLQDNLFFNIQQDPKHENPLEDSELTERELRIKSNFRRVLDSLKKE